MEASYNKETVPCPLFTQSRRRGVPRSPHPGARTARPHARRLHLLCRTTHPPMLRASFVLSRDAPPRSLRHALVHPRATGPKGRSEMATREERLARLLSLVDVLEPLSGEELAELAERCPPFTVEGGEDFYSPERHDSGLFLILEGRVRVCTSSPAGKRTTLELLGSGTVFWARRLEALQAHAAHAQAVGPAVVAFMGRDALDHFILAKP